MERIELSASASRKQHSAPELHPVNAVYVSICGIFNMRKIRLKQGMPPNVHNLQFLLYFKGTIIVIKQIKFGKKRLC